MDYTPRKERGPPFLSAGICKAKRTHRLRPSKPSRLVIESPREKKERYRARLEKLLVDLIADPLISKLVSQSEYPEIYDSAFFSCPIDESSLFRYAKRRSVYDEIMKMIEEGTEINLRTVK